MELRQLAYFVAVVEAAHFTRAAEQLRIAQPAVSQQIRRLEAELGERLLYRDRRTVALTSAGKPWPRCAGWSPASSASGSSCRCRTAASCAPSARSGALTPASS